MDEYIKREEIRRAYEKLARSYMHGEPYIADWKFDEMIEELPASDVVPVRHRRWIEKQEKDTFAGYLYSYECSECGRVKQRKEPYCPNCGAKMDLNEG